MADGQCRVCGALPRSITVTKVYDDGSPGESLPAEAEQLVPIVWGVRRCPGCSGYFYRSQDITSHQGGPEHDVLESLRRLGPIETLTILDRAPGGDDERIRIEAGLEATVEALKASLDGDAAAELARYYRRARSWSEVAALLRHRDAAVRAGAVRVLKVTPYDDPQPGLIVLQALEELLGDPQCGTAAAVALTGAAIQSRSGFAAMVPALLARFEDEDIVIRGHVSDILHIYFAGRWNDPPSTREILAWIPILVQHLKCPRPAPLTTHDGYTTGDIARTALGAIVDADAAAAHAVREAIADAGAEAEEVRRHLRWRFGASLGAP